MFVAEAGAARPGREFRIFPTEKARVPGTFTFAIPTGLTGTLSAYPFVQGYAVQGFLAGVKNSTVEDFDPEIVLWRLRYAVLRVAINAKGGRALDPSSAPVTRMAASGFGMIPPFHYWDIFQERINWGPRNGDRLITRPSRAGGGIGFRAMPPGTRFEDILEAPPDGNRGEPLLLKPGLVFVVHMPATGGFAFGKFQVEDITLEPPDGLPLKGREPGPW